ncbi:hypothetical protein VTI74DRAFT_7044 [Chaetomium olivicolor]
MAHKSYPSPPTACTVTWLGRPGQPAETTGVCGVRAHGCCEAGNLLSGRVGPEQEAFRSRSELRSRPPAWRKKKAITQSGTLMGQAAISGRNTGTGCVPVHASSLSETLQPSCVGLPRFRDPFDVYILATQAAETHLELPRRSRRLSRQYTGRPSPTGLSYSGRPRRIWQLSLP